MEFATFALTALTVLAGPARSAGLDEVQHGKVEWFTGTPEQAIARAKAEDKLVFIDFWTGWCSYCKKLDREAFVDPAVIAALKGMVAINVDAESENGAQFAKSFGLRGYPALIVLDSLGRAEDYLGGYLSARLLLAEIERVKRGERTISALRATVKKNPADLDARYALSTKLAQVGDEGAAQDQISAIEAADPKGESDAGRKIRLARAGTELRALVAEVMRGYETDQKLNTTRLESFLESMKLAEVQFEGWNMLGNLHGQIGDLAASRQALARAWEYCPAEHRASFGSELAWNYYEYDDDLSAQDRAFALRVAEAAVKSASESSAPDADMLDTLACCYFMNGQREQAIATVERAIELEPDNEDWAERLSSFRSE